MSKKKLVHLIRDRKHMLERGAIRRLKGTISDGLPLPVLIETFLTCLTTLLLSRKKVVPECKSRLSWDLPETPSLLTIHKMMLAMKKEIVNALEIEFEGTSHLLVESICELEDALDTMMTFLLEEEKSPEHLDLIKIGELLSKEYSDDIICIYDNDGNLLYISPSIEKILGYTAPEWKKEGPQLMIKNPVYEVMDIKSQGIAPFENVKYMVVIPHKTGKEIIVEVEEKFIKNPKGEILGLWSRMHDVSVRENLRKELHYTHQRYEEIFEEAADIIFILDDDGRLKSVNRRLRELTGFSTEYLRGKPLEDIIHENDRDRCRGALDKLRRGKTIEFEASMFSVNGDHIITSIRCNPYLTRSSHDGVIGIARDITEKKKIEEELKSKMALLERFRCASVDRERRIKELLQQLKDAGGGERLD